MKRVATGAIAGAALLLAGCGLQPLYGGGVGGGAVRALGDIAIGPIPGKAGYLMRGALEGRLATSATPAYRLEVELDDQVLGFGVRRDNAVTRERRTLRARYRLVDVRQGTVLLDATAGADAGIDVVSSEYATLSAEQTALERLVTDISDQIVTRLALFARRTADKPAG